MKMNEVEKNGTIKIVKLNEEKKKTAKRRKKALELSEDERAELEKYKCEKDSRPAQESQKTFCVDVACLIMSVFSNRLTGT